jgi:hypothetical protein
LPASSYSIASSGKQQRSSRSLSLVAAVVAAAVAAAVVGAAAVALVAAAAPLSQLNSKSISYAFLRRL